MSSSMPRTEHAEGSTIRELAEQYGEALEGNGHAERRTVAYQWNTTANGEPLPVFVRRAVRTALLHGKRTGTEAGPLDSSVPFAFGPSADQFEPWLADEMAGPDGSPINRAELALYESRADLLAAFPGIEGDAENCRRYAHWLAADPTARQVLGARWRKREVDRGEPATDDRGLARRVATRAERELASFVSRAREKVGGA